jgi:hypothetical protein
MNTTESGEYWFMNLTQGDYEVCEVLQDGWIQTFPANNGTNACHTVTINSGSVYENETSVDFGNQPLGKIIIIKDSRPDDGYDFPFTIDSNVTNETSFELDDCDQPTDCPFGIDDDDLSNMTMFSNIPAGLYNVSENIPFEVQGTWELTNIVCVSANGTSVFSGKTVGNTGGSIGIDLAPGDEVTCTFINETDFPTRTQGYWKTHTNVTQDLFENPIDQESAAVVGFTNGTIIIGSSTTGVVIDNIKEVFGLYYSNNHWESDKFNTPKSDGTARSYLDQTMIVMIHQLLTAKLNCGAFGCTETANTLIAACDEAFATGNLTALSSVDTPFPGSGCTEELDWYNNSGETFADNFPPGASPSLSRMLAEMTIVPTDLHVDDTGISRWDDPTPTAPPS